MSKEIVIRCDHCNKQLKEEGYTTFNIKAYGIELLKELELCNECAIKFREQIMDYIQPKHYKY